MHQTVPNRKASVLIVTENFPNKVESYRGIYILEQLREIAKEYNVHVVVPLNVASRWVFSFLSQAREKNIDGIHVYYLKYPYLPFERFIPHLSAITRNVYRRYLLNRLYRKAVKLGRKYPFTLIHGQEAMIGDLAIPLGERLGVKTLFTVHTLRDESVRSLGRETMDSVIENLKRADRIIAVSNLARQSYAGLLDLSKTTVVYNGVDEGKMACSKPRNCTTVVLLSVCHLVELKKIDLILAALRDIKQQDGAAFHYRIVGGGNTHPYRRLIRQYGLEKQVDVVGPVPPGEIAGYYAACDVFVLPSVRESFGIVFLEAMLCGRPVICSSQSGFSEIIEDGKEGFIVQPDDPLDLKQKLLTLMQNPELRLRMGEAGKRLAARFTMERQAQEILAVYQSLMQA